MRSFYGATQTQRQQYFTLSAIHIHIGNSLYTHHTRARALIACMCRFIFSMALFPFHLENNSHSRACHSARPRARCHCKMLYSFAFTSEPICIGPVVHQANHVVQAVAIGGFCSCCCNGLSNAIGSANTYSVPSLCLFFFRTETARFLLDFPPSQFLRTRFFISSNFNIHDFQIRTPIFSMSAEHFPADRNERRTDTDQLLFLFG